MGKKGKIGKARKDKFYHLAKETGFRARSAFKLLQLNRKYEFLQDSRVCIDLCAAPGGWLQVAAQNMPVSSVIIGVDLVPIKPIPNVKTFTEDITSDKCRTILKKELHDWKVDVVLNDGAPNVGKNWVQDAFSQAELTLSAMKLATDFLKKGGWFVTKVFRSKDYQSLMWVFSQLFRKVYATKPQASRNESAEIFVVCQGYMAPDKLDEKFTDPKYVFKEVLGGSKKLDIMHQKAKPKAEGYGDDDLVLHHTLNASELVKSDNHMELLVDKHEVILDTEELANHKLTTDELREYFKDIKVLGRREIRLILNWRKKMRAHYAALKKAASQSAEVVEEEEESEDEETKMDEMVAQMQEEEQQAARKKRKAVLKEKRKLRDKMDLKMVIPGDEPIQTDEPDLFNLKNIKKKFELENVETDDKLDISESEEEEDEQMPTKIAFDRHKDEFEENEDDIFSDVEDDDDEDEDGEKDMEAESEEEEDEEEEDDNAAGEDADSDAGAPSNPLVVDLGTTGIVGAQQVALWYRKSGLSGVLEEEGGDAGLSGLELAAAAADYKRRGGTVLDADGGSDGEEEDESEEEEEEEEEEQPSRKKAKLAENEEENGAEEDSDSDDDSDSDSEADDYFDPHSLVKNRKQARAVKNNAKKDGFEVVSATEPSRKVVKLSPVELAIGEEMIKSGKRRREIIEGSYNRYTFNDEELPVWFLKDEQRHNHKQLPVSKSQIDEQKEKLKAINARPIKKVAEAKARKKKKSVRKLEKVRKKAEAVSDTADLSDKEKWNQIRQIYSKAGLLKAKKVNVAYVVAKKGTGKRVRRPAGVQGRFRVVDPRMKKDDKARKKDEKANKGKKVKKGRGKGISRN